MTTRILRWLLSSTVYLLYTSVVLLFLLWLLFPADIVKGYLEQRLDKQYAQFDWKIGSLGLALPDKIVLTNVRVNPAGTKNSLLILNQLAFAPDLKHIFGENKKIRYNLEMLQGTIRGHILLPSDSTQVECIGTLDGLHLEQLEFLQQDLQRRLNGTAAGTFSGQVKKDKSGQVTLRGNLNLSDGVLQFRQPVLGLGQLPYTKIETDFSYKANQWTFEKGKLQAASMNGIFRGNILSEDSLADSQVQFEGSLTPRSEMFSEMKNSKMMQMVRAHLKDGALPFTVRGTVGSPAILFAGGLSQALKNFQGSTK